MVSPGSQQAISVFFSYAHEDEALRDKLAKHLKLLERQGVIQQWHDRQILAGTEWKGQIDHHLETAQIILLLISADFLDSDYCYDLEMKRALERHEAGEARVISIVLRPLDNLWESPFGKLQALPTDGKAVTLWTNEDEAFANIAKGIRLTAEAWQRGDRAAFPQTGENLGLLDNQPPGLSSDNRQIQVNAGHSTGWQVSVHGGNVFMDGKNLADQGQPPTPDASRSGTAGNAPGRLTPRQRQRLEQRCESLHQEWQVRSNKLQKLRSDYAIEAGTAVKFQLEQQIQTEEAQLTQLEAQMDELEQAIAAGVMPPSAQA